MQNPLLIPWLENDVTGFHVRMPICHMVPISRTYGEGGGGGAKLTEVREVGNCFRQEGCKP